MSKVSISGAQTGTAQFTIQAPATNTNRTLTLPDADGTVVAAETPSVSSTNTVTTKIPIVINGITYYLLASTSGA